MDLATTQFLFFWKECGDFSLIKESLSNVTSPYRKHHTLGYI